MSYSPNPLRHNPDPSGGLYCMDCLVPCSEASPCRCDAPPAPKAKTAADFAAAVPEDTADVRLVADGDAGEAGDSVS